MPISGELAREIAREVLGLDLDAGAAEQIAQRLSAFWSRVRALDEQRLVGLEPTGTFDASHPVWTQERPGLPAWAGLGPATPGSSGYGGTDALLDTPSTATAAALPPAAADLLYMTAGEAAARIRRRELSPVELTRAVLARIAELNPRLNAFITVTADAAMAQARAAEAALHGDVPIGPLHGVPLAVKDLFCTRGVRTTGGARVLNDWVPDTDATTVERLRGAGAILVGKTHTHEFAYGASSNNEHFGPARNPWDPSRIPGGSSGGSAIAVAAGMAHMALGSDTAGSVRIPAAACGIVGLKPTYGRVSKFGVLPLAWSLDTVGPITRSVGDAALLLGILAGPDPRDHTALPIPTGAYLAAVRAGADGLKGVRVGVLRAWFDDRVEDEVRAAGLAAVQVLHDLGARVVDVQLPTPDQMMLVNRLITLAEASSYHTPYLESQPENYSDDVRLRLQLGQFMMARDYIAGQRLRGEMCQHLATVMADIDVLVAPTLPFRAPRIGQLNMDWNGIPDAVMEALIRLASPFNVTGSPAISMPCGLPTGLPVALQIVGRPFDEETVLRVAAAYEAATEWTHRRPAL